MSSTGDPPPGPQPSTTGKPRVCDKCGRADNPLSPLSFFERNGEDLCEVCYRRLYVQKMPGVADDSGGTVSPIFGKLVVIPCPDCRGTSHKPHGFPCETCCGYGSVRISENSLPIYSPAKKKPEILTED